MVIEVRIMIPVEFGDEEVHEQSLCVWVMSVYLEISYVGVFSMYTFI